MHNCRLLCNQIYPRLWIIFLSVERWDNKRSPLHLQIAAVSINVYVHIGTWLAWFHSSRQVPQWGNVVGFIDGVEEISYVCLCMFLSTLLNLKPRGTSAFSIYSGCQYSIRINCIGFTKLGQFIEFPNSWHRVSTDFMLVYRHLSCF